ncbi:hypothetical protein AWC38_SpisGene4970 [Stylophora pistillata]|uniref:Uncharacterized protein n=1 Tax=Stylophora pistillata TaxID=50429 RepID=A0A2B4SPC0_STYPI|nr:hypothetical protein AWC38_SpisGene4970 [Stylophora pistillata]
MRPTFAVYSRQELDSCFKTRKHFCWKVERADRSKLNSPSETMESSKALFVLFLVSCVLLSVTVYCQKAEEQGLPGIRWGRHFREDDRLIQRGSKGRLWRAMNQKRKRHYRLNDAVQEKES